MNLLWCLILAAWVSLTSYALMLSAAVGANWFFLLTAVSLPPLLLILLLERERRKQRQQIQKLKTEYDQVYPRLLEREAYVRFLEEENSELERLALTDDLTLLYNYRYFQKRLAEFIGNQRLVSLMMLDVDYFKEINDRYGHDRGNGVLTELAQVLQGCIRYGDVLVRYGGEEFGVILPNTDVHEARKVAERIRNTVAEYLFVQTGEEEPISITLSIGIACYPDHAGNKDQLIRGADRALYEAKKSGRNTVRLFE